ncbi:MAG: UDP-N-acetylmuramoyl-tripeptide--D-alanyl-D-alanine ligase [Pseudomonadota bacterium]
MKLPLRVQIDLRPSDAAQAMKAEQSEAAPKNFSGIALDTRAIQKGDLFFALRASRDGHEFVSQAFEKGASAAVVDHEIVGSGPLFLVGNTSQALRDLARDWRRNWGGKIVAISGSNGKTTTKEMTAALLAADRPTLKAPGTWNNQLGVPLTLLMLRPEHRVAVLEMGMNAYGELRELGRTAEHDVAVLTNVGPAHLEKFGSLEGVAKAKRELFEGLKKDGVAVVNLEDRNIRKLAEQFPGKKVTVSMGGGADLRAKIREDLRGNGFVLDLAYGSSSVDLRVPFVGIHNVSNLLCACGAAYALGVPAEKLQAGIDRVEPVEMRLEVIPFPKGIRIVNDCYNANPASMLVALETVRNLTTDRRIAVIGDMRELGEFSTRAHRDIGIKIAGFKYARLFVMGQFAGDVRQGAVQGGMSNVSITVGTTHEELAEAIARELRPNDTVLVKGSRAMKLETITERLAAILKREEGK